MKEVLSGTHHYRYNMGFSINGEPLPDPAEFTAKVSDLDTLGTRNMAGTLQRKMVATKHHIELKYKNIEWEMITHITAQMKSKEFFRLTYPDPFDGLITITAYVGDRNAESVWNPANGVWIGNLAFNCIER